MKQISINKLVCVAFACVFSSCSQWLVPAADDFTEEVHQTFPLDANGRVSVDNVNGTIQITAWDRQEVQVDAVKRANSAEDLSEISVDFKTSPDSVGIKTRLPSSDGGRNGSGHVDYEIKVPRRVRLDKVNTINGKIEAAGIEGVTRLVTVNGTVVAKNLSGSGSFKSVNGSIDVKFLKLDSDKGIDLETVNGKVVLAVPASANARVKASTVNGPISTDFGLSPKKNFPVGHTLDGQLGDGGPLVKMQSVNGPLHLTKAD